MNQTDKHRHQDLIEGCRRKDRFSQTRIYELYYKAMYNTALRMMKQPQEAEDMLQESFLVAFDRIHSFEFNSSFGSWMKRIVINNCINQLKKRKVNFIDEASLVDIPQVEEENLDFNSSDILKINQLVSELPEGYRVIFSLYLFEGYDHNEIGEVLQISSSTSRSQYMRAKQKLKKQFLTQS